MQRSRKEKSLELLCIKFLSFYPSSPKTDERIIICLDSLANRLYADKCRISIIINILESIEIVSKIRKNEYRWHGRSQIKNTISKLSEESLKNKYIHEVKKLVNSSFSRKYDTKIYDQCVALEENEHKEPEEIKNDMPTGTKSLKKDKSMYMLTQMFLMLLLNSKDRLVSIKFAGKFILRTTENISLKETKLQTIIRRLYDVVNILSCIGLVEKYKGYNIDFCKPVYKYIGHETGVSELPDASSIDVQKQSIDRADFKFHNKLPGNSWNEQRYFDTKHQCQCTSNSSTNDTQILIQSTTNGLHTYETSRYYPVRPQENHLFNNNHFLHLSTENELDFTIRKHLPDQQHPPINIYTSPISSELRYNYESIFGNSIQYVNNMNSSYYNSFIN